MKSISSPTARAWAVALVLLAARVLFPTPLHAQATSGQIVGQVTDPTGAVISGAVVTATDDEKGVSFIGHSDAAGNFTVLNLPPGIYSLTASAAGFGEEKYTHVVIAIDQHQDLNFKLKVGTVATAVEVTEAAPVLQTQTAEVGTVISGDAIVDLPLEGRNFYALTLLVPGVTTVGGSINSFALSVSGQREFANSIQLDGIESTTNRTQDVTVTPNVDSVEEFKVTTASYNAEFGNAAGGVVEVQTKAGTNHIHGDAFEFFRPNFLTAKETLPGVSAPQPASVLKQHNFGGILGGPIKRDRSFLFGAYEGVRQKNAYAYVDSTVPFGLLNIESNGDVDFSHLVDPCAGMQCTSNGKPSGTAPGLVDPIFDPLVSVYSYGGKSSQFPGNVIPASRVSKAGLNTLLNFYPKPNLPGIENGWFRNYAVFSPTSDNTDKVDSRFDQVITNNDRLYAVYHWQGENSLVTDPYWGHTVVVGAGDADQANKQDNGAQSVSVTYDHIFSPTALNEFRFGYLNYYQDQYSLLNGTDYSTKYGVGNVMVPNYPATVAYPQIFLADGYLAGGSTYKPYHVKDQNYQYTDAFTWSRIAKHEMKFGGDLRVLNSHPDFSLFPTGFDYFESFGYAETANFYTTYIPGAYNYAGGSDLADLVLGLPTDVDIGLQLTDPHTNSWNLDFYAQDSYKVTPRLTLNYGLRYEYQDPWVEAHNYLSNYDVASGNILVAGRGSNSSSLISARVNDFSPRFGFAWMVDPKTVLRAGGAIFYSPENDGREDILTQNYPFSRQASYTDWVYDGPAAAAPASPWEYELDTGVARSTTISLPASGVIVPSTIKNGNLQTTYSINPNLKSGTTGSFNLTAERQLTRTISLEAGYVGSISKHLSYEIGDINANLNGTSANSDGFITPYLGKIQYLNDVGLSNFSALEVKLKEQMAKNTGFLLSYTWSHSLDNGPAPFNLGHINNDSPQDPYNLKAEYASSDTDVRHNFVFSGTQNLPFGKGQRWGSNWGPVKNAILGGWRYSPIATLHSGSPVNVVAGVDPNSALPGLRPNVTGNPNAVKGKRTVLQWFNTGAFSVPTGTKTQPFPPGDAGRNLVIGPAWANLDSSLAKDFQVEGKLTIDVRAEAFNTFNTVHYANPNGDLNSGIFGQITSVVGSSNRVAQLAAKFIF